MQKLCQSQCNCITYSARRLVARFSVDIDVVFCDPAVGREEAVRQISRELIRIRAEIVSMGFEAESIYISARLSFLSGQRLCRI